MIYTVFVYLFVAVTGIQIIYYLSFLSLYFHKSKPKSKEKTPVSVIVCAKNEADNLSKLIPLLLQQSHPKYELVLVNDASSDHTLDVLEEFQKEDKRINIVDVKNNEAFWGNKKYALTLGIKAAKFNHLLFTDADCVPASENWISSMSSHFTDTKSIVVGYGKYRRKKFSLVNALVRYETLLAAMQYFSYAKLGSPYMAVGRNLGYTKDEFFKVKGFISHMQIKSGDDDLFIQDAANKNNTTICMEKESFTVSEAPMNFQQWFRQKRRHISTSAYYKFKHKFFLGLFFLSKLFFWLLVPFAIYFYPEFFLMSLIGLFIVINFISVGMAAKKLEETSVLYGLPFLEIFLVLFQITIFIANSISKPTHWK
jgi:glycosyltransferase involved in cell wall biosynthesis